MDKAKEFLNENVDKRFLNIIFQLVILIVIIALIMQMNNNIMYLSCTLGALVFILLIIYAHTYLTTYRNRRWETFLTNKRKNLTPQAPYYINSIPPWESRNTGNGAINAAAYKRTLRPQSPYYPESIPNRECRI